MVIKIDHTLNGINMIHYGCVGNANAFLSNFFFVSSSSGALKSPYMLRG